MTSTHLASSKLALRKCLKSDDKEKNLEQQSSLESSFDNDAEKNHFTSNIGLKHEN